VPNLPQCRTYLGWLSSLFKPYLTTCASPAAVTTSLILGGILVSGCGDGDGLLLPSEGAAASIEVLLGNGQSGKVGEPLADLLVVEVTDTRGVPVEGAPVTFELTSAGPGADIIPRFATTDANGQASARIVLGTTIGRQTGEARVAVESGTIAPRVSFTATALSENASTMAPIAGEDQTGHVSAPLDERLVVQVTDEFGNPSEGVPIRWEAVGGGTVSDTETVTDDQGRASVERVSGPAIGQQTTVASSEGLAGSPVTFVHTALAGDASRLIIVSGDNQSGQVGSELSAELVVRLIDGDGNGVPNTPVAWVVAVGGGSVTPGDSNTDEEGRTSARWTLGTSPGANRLDAVVSGVGVVSFDATAGAGAPASLSIVTQPAISARNGERLARQPVIQLRDAAGNPLAQAGVPVSAALGSGAGSLTGTRQRNTDANGRAVFADLAISGGPGRYTLVFASAGYSSVTSSNIELRQIATVTAITGDFPDPSPPGSAFTVQFRVTSDGPSPDGSVTVTDGVESCTGALVGGGGSCQLSLSTSGDRTLRATYSGAPGFGGSSDTETHRVQVAPPQNRAPSADFTWRCENLSCQFADGSRDEDGSINGWSWNFGDGSGTATTKDPTHAFPSAGTYAVTLTVTDNSGGTDGASANVTVQAAPPPSAGNQPPTAALTVDCRELKCRFSSRGSDDFDGRIDRTLWDFGDGSQSADRNPDYEYASAGSYTVTLAVTDDDGATNAVSQLVTVTGPPPSPENQAPRPEFTFRCDELKCDFDDQSSDSDGKIQSRLWSFGDGGTSDEGRPKHEYAGPGTYQVTLTVTDDDGASGSVTHSLSVAVKPAPNQSPTAAFDGGCDGLTCSFTSTASNDPDGGIASRSWDFGDGTGSNEVNPVHSYGAPGGYTVVLTVTDVDGATDTETQQVSVAAPPSPNQPPEAAFSANCSDLTCSFASDESRDEDGSIASSSWIFGDGTGSEEPSPSHTYPAAGTYSVTLTVTDDEGASSQVVHEVTVLQP
jgi:PKD repeat protein